VYHQRAVKQKSWAVLLVLVLVVIPYNSQATQTCMGTLYFVVVVVAAACYLTVMWATDRKPDKRCF